MPPRKRRAGRAVIWLSHTLEVYRKPRPPRRTSTQRSQLGEAERSAGSGRAALRRDAGAGRDAKAGSRCEGGHGGRMGSGCGGGNRRRVAGRTIDQPAIPCKTRTQQCRIPHFSSDPLNRRPFRPERAPSERFIVSRLILRSNSNAGFSSLDDTRPVRLETTRTLGRSDSRRQASELGFHLNSQAPGKRSKANRLPHRPRNVDHWRKTCIQTPCPDQKMYALS